MGRQNLRKMIILVSFLLFPVTLFFFSPALIIQGAAEGIITGSFMTFSLLFIFSLLFGRAYCGWLCPAAGLQEGCFGINNKKARGGRLDIIKFLVWIPWVGLIGLFFLKAGAINGIQPFYQMQGGISVTDSIGYIIFYGVTGLIVVMAILWGRRAFCHYLCWMAPFMIIGDKISQLLSIPALCLKVKDTYCINCKKCNSICPMSLDVHQMVTNRTMYHRECVLCGSCVDTCPNRVIAFGVGRRSQSGKF